MNGVGHQLLTDAAFAINQHAPVGAGHQRQLLAQRLHRHAVADDQGLLMILQPVEFLFEPAMLDGIFGGDGDLVDGERLL